MTHCALCKAEGGSEEQKNITLHCFVFIEDNVETRIMSLLIFSSRSVSLSFQVVKMINSMEYKVCSLNVVRSWHFTWSPSDKHKDQGVMISIFITQMTVL